MVFGLLALGVFLCFGSRLVVVWASFLLVGCGARFVLRPCGAFRGGVAVRLLGVLCVAGWRVSDMLFAGGTRLAEVSFPWLAAF